MSCCALALLLHGIHFFIRVFHPLLQIVAVMIELAQPLGKME